MKKMLMMISAGLACCVFFDASCSSAPPVSELTSHERTKAATIMIDKGMAKTPYAVNTLIREMGPEAVRDLIRQLDQQKEREEAEASGLAEARRLQAQYDAECEEEDRQRAADEEAEERRLREEALIHQGIDPGTQTLLEQLAAEEQIEAYRNQGQRQAQRTADEAATRQMLEDEELARLLGEQERMQTDEAIARSLQQAEGGMGEEPAAPAQAPAGIPEETKDRLRPYLTNPNFG